jgi:hypothetical protein
MRKTSRLGKTGLGALGLVAALAASSAFAAHPALAKLNDKFIGVVTHVSATDIKVKDPHNGQVLGFVLTPHFNNAYKHGKTAQMAYLKPGDPVEIIYDQKALGVRHADKIIMLDRLPAKYR